MSKQIYILLLMCIAASCNAAGIDVTFLIASDIHYGVGDDHMVPANQTAIDNMNSITDVTHPTLPAAKIGKPLGVVVTGDLTQDSKQTEWNLFTADYGLNGDARLVYPVYEGWGNHDQHAGDTTPVTEGIKARNPKRPGIVKISKNGYHYSWEWQQLHCIMLNEYPGEAKGEQKSWGSPLDSLAFLKNDLAENIANSNKPVIIFMHFAFDGWGLSNWSLAEQNAFHDAIIPYKQNIIAMFGGHGHTAMRGKWNDIDFFQVAAAQPTTDDNGFALVHLTDNNLTVANRYLADNTWGKVFQKQWNISSQIPLVSKSVVAPITEQIRQKYELSDFYKKHTTVKNFLLVSSEKVDDYALLEAAYLVDKVIGHRPDVLDALTEKKVHLVVMAHNEFTTDVPEHSKMTPKDFWDRRARGLGPSYHCPVISCGEENLLCFKGDPYSRENIMIHEFGHCIHLGMRLVDDQFNKKLEALYKKAKDAGLWKGTYAGSNKAEYFAEAVQSWFDTNRQNNYIHNHVNTRQELKEYDPALAELVKGVLGDSQWRYKKPADRKEKLHLAGYDPKNAPAFVWRKKQEAK